MVIEAEISFVVICGARVLFICMNAISEQTPSSQSLY